MRGSNANKIENPQGNRAEGDARGRTVSPRKRRNAMPAIHRQVQKARDLMPVIAAASPEHDEKRELTKPVVKP